MQLLQHGARKGYRIEPKQSRVHAFAVHPSCVVLRQQQSTTTDPCKHTTQPAGGHCTASVLTHKRRQHTAVCYAAPDANVTVQESLQDYICSGPLLGAACITPQQVQQELPVWQKLGQQLAMQLGFDHDNMDAIQRLRIYHYYLPVFFWIQQQLEQHKQKYQGQDQPAPPLVLGISAPQGCGKSTLPSYCRASWLIKRT